MLVHAQARLADADRHALAVLAAGADAGIEREVVADHADAMQVGRAVADQHGAFHRRADLAVLDLVGLGALEHVFAGGDVDLAAAEAHGVEAVLHRGDDLLRIVLAGQHVGVGHARHRHMRVRFRAGHCRSASCSSAARSAGPACSRRGCRPRSARCDWSACLRRRWRANRAASLHGAVVDDGHAFGGDLLAHQAGERRRLLAVEIAFEAVTDRLVQHHARPAGAEHDVHFAGRRGHCFEIDQCLAHGLVDRAAATRPASMKR